MKPVVLWFRNDLRLSDHRALNAALAAGAPLIPVYILDDVTPGRWTPGGASNWWLDKSLRALSRDIATRGGRLVLRKGATLDVLPGIVAEAGAGAVYFSRTYEPWAADIEARLKQKFDAAGVSFKRFGGSLLREPEEVRTKSGEAFKVYTPFWKALSADFAPPAPRAAPKSLSPYEADLESDDLESWALHPKKPDWSQGFSKLWQPGEAGAHERLTAFLKTALDSYADDRNRPDKDGTSRLSPHLHFGEITPAQCWTAAVAASQGTGKGLETFLKELAWREFSYTLLQSRPDLPDAPFREEFARFPWRRDSNAFEAWKRGRTGYPIVDAGMRELWATGYMHNRVRMIAASFLIKDLLIPWQEGEAWFWDTLVDADLASNAASWQWVAGSGADAAPYFRIFNPVTQGKTFDPEGIYVRRWVPELRGLPASLIHAPWRADTEQLRAVDVEIGKTYPAPIVDHDTARRRALAAYDEVKAQAKKNTDA